MKKIIFTFAIASVILISSSCDHVDNAYPFVPSTDLDTNLFPGIWDDYLTGSWPDFDTIINDNPNRNALIEDFTGHNCSSCPSAASTAHGLHEGNPDRIYVASIHASNLGMSDFQSVNIASGYTIDFTNSNGIEMGEFFGAIPGSGFFGNPSGTVNKVLLGTEYFYADGFWSTKASEVMAAPLDIAIKAKVNYYPTTKGLFLHTEVENVGAIVDDSELGILVYVIEDSLVGPQNVSSTYTPDYIHRDIMRGTITGQTWGRDVTDGDLVDGKYYLDYSYSVPDQLAPDGQSTTYNADNMHLLVLVYDKTTYEIYQVIKKKIEE